MTTEIKPPKTNRLVKINEKLFKNIKYSDVEFIVGKMKAKIYCLKIFLSVNSEVFDRMFYGIYQTNDTNKKSIEITDLTEKVNENVE